MARMEGDYGAGKYCVTKNGKEECRNIDQLSATIAKSRNYDELTEAWAGWHSVGRQMRKDYTRFVELANEGAREIGFSDLGAMWRSPYDMKPEEFEAEVDRLWGQVKPLYDQMHCYARTKLARKYGEDKVPAGKPIPAHLFGNLWAQQWNKIYDDILKPYPAVKAENVDVALVKQGYTAEKMVKQAETFYTSLGMPSLPKTFWERSMLTRPRDRDVVCHASAWHMDLKEDVRIKMCITPTEEDLGTIYHELGHVYYYLAYKDQPFMYENGAHDGFHEAIGDTVLLSMTPAYLAKVGLRETGTALARGRSQRADEDRGRQDRFPAIRQADRPMALGRVLGKDQTRGLQQGLVAAARAGAGCLGAGATHRGRLRPGREIPRAGQHALHALLPVIRHAVPVPPGAVPGGGLQGPPE